jgi:plastocyanin
VTRVVWAGAALAALALAPHEFVAQSVLDRSPNLEGVWSAAPGRLHFHFVHRFDVTGPPARKVFNSPTFLFATGVVSNVDVGARYATSSLVVPATPNELEVFARWAPLAGRPDAPIEIGLQVAHNRAAESVDGELALGRSFGSLRVLASGRAFSSFAGGDSEFAVAGGARWRLTRHLALAGDFGGLVGVDDADAVWGVGLQMGIPYTPHSFSLHLSNANTATLQGASVGAGDRRWGFEFTVPVTFSRYFGRGPGDSGPAPGSDAAAAPAAVVEMDDRLRFLPDTIRVRAGETVEWRNTSALIHTVTADPDRAWRPENVRLPAGAERFDSGELVPGARFAHTFTVPGVYTYVCLPHEPAGMIGVVIVE